MKILDSNLWVKGTLKTNQTAVDLLAAVADGTITTAMDEYILAEILAAFDRVLTGHRHDQVLTAFLSRLHTMDGLIEVPQWQTQRSTQQQSVLDYQRSRTAITMLAQICTIQAKDAPILVYAYTFRDQTPSVLTNDESFADCEPAQHNLSTLTMQYIA
jgi:citrate synthase